MTATIGIDLGTTHSLAAVLRDGVPELIPNAHGEFLTPSVVGVLASGEVVVGAAARELRVTHPERCASCFKRHMGSDHQVRLADQRHTAHELSSMVLRSLKQDAERHLGAEVHDAVITVPAYFNDHQRQATKLAGEMAGLNVRRIINEPSAAALVYGFHDRDAEKHLCVIDLGGGTFDVTVMEVFEGTLEIRATAGESMLGGEDFTDRLVAAVLNREGLQLEYAELKQPLRVARLRSECEQAKRRLARDESTHVRLPGGDGAFGEKPKRVRIDRATFSRLTTQLIERIAAPIGRALRDGECAPEEIDDVILVGGSTRMTVLRDFVTEYFGKPPIMQLNPDEVVALGAAVQAALLDENAAVEDMMMTDVCPFTLGVEVAKEFGGQMADGYFHPVLHRNSTIPTSREEVFSTVRANQQQVEVRVFQGDARRCRQRRAGALTVANLPPGPAGSEIRIRFTYDVNGILEVEAYAPSGGRKFRTVLTNNVKGLSRDEIDQAVARLQQLKFYPSEDLEAQRLARFCERMLGELHPSQREHLDRTLDMFEDVMARGDRETFNEARTTLLMVLSSLGIEYDESSSE
ncbi:MAG: molecular chaperone HscC [Pirellulales bacterium]